MEHVHDTTQLQHVDEFIIWPRLMAAQLPSVPGTQDPTLQSICFNLEPKLCLRLPPLCTRVLQKGLMSAMRVRDISHCQVDLGESTGRAGEARAALASTRTTIMMLRIFGGGREHSVNCLVVYLRLPQVREQKGLLSLFVQSCLSEQRKVVKPDSRVVGLDKTTCPK
jgi:hypothetical protein